MAESRRTTPRAGVDFDPVKLVTEVNKVSSGFHFTIQAVPSPTNWVELVEAWSAKRADAEHRGLPFDEPVPSRGTIGSATYVRCEGEWRESNFVLKVSMQSEAGRPFVIFIEEQHMFPEMGVWDRPNVEESIAAQLVFLTMEKISGATAEDLDGYSISGNWMKSWT